VPSTLVVAKSGAAGAGLGAAAGGLAGAGCAGAGVCADAGPAMLIAISVTAIVVSLVHSMLSSRCFRRRASLDPR